jgi:hypothetical protein
MDAVANKRSVTAQPTEGVPLYASNLLSAIIRLFHTRSWFGTKKTGGEPGLPARRLARDELDCLAEGRRQAFGEAGDDAGHAAWPGTARWRRRRCATCSPR